MSRAKSVSGLWGNLRFVVVHKSWAALALVLAGAAIGVALATAALA